MNILTRFFMLAIFVLTTMFVVANEPAQAADYTDSNIPSHQIAGMIDAPVTGDGPTMQNGGYPNGTEIVYSEPGARILRDPWGRYWVEIMTPWGWRVVRGPYSTEEEAKDALDDLKGPTHW